MTGSFIMSVQSSEDGGRAHGMEESDHDGWVEISDVTGMECAEDIAKVSDLSRSMIEASMRYNDTVPSHLSVRSNVSRKFTE